MLLEDKRAVIYGGGGAIGGAMARAFAREGARVFLAGRTLATLEQVAQVIRSAGGVADTAEVDALDQRSVDQHADAVAAAAGGIEICSNLISPGEVQGTLAEMSLDDYTRPVFTAVRTTFLTSRAADRHMIRQGSGVILAFGGEGDPPRGYYLGGLQVAFHAVEAMRRQLASELGPDGVRVVTLRTGGIPESIPDHFEGRREEIAASITRSTLLGRAATLEDVGNVAAFVASDQARTMTAATVNVSAGALID